MTRVKIAALTLLTLTALSGAGVLVHGSTVTPRQDGDVTHAPRTVVAAPSAPLCPEMLARCAPIPPEPATRLEVSVPEVPMDDVAGEYTKAWNGIEVVR